MAENTSVQPRKHAITIEDRKSVRISGISEVSSYDASGVVLESDWGRLVIQGAELHISSFDQTSGNLFLEGRIEALQYFERRSKTESFFSRLLK